MRNVPFLTPFTDQKYTLGSKDNPRQQEEKRVNRNICTLPVWDLNTPSLGCRVALSSQLPQEVVFDILCGKSIF